MMPLTMAKTGEVNVIKRVGGREETRRFLENLGFVAGGNVMVISEIGGNMIVNVKESRVAINKDMANKIMV
ncbi:MAG: ferrous iron transport protein A [Lachnospiraceae bacterium]|nr:ferrous iron transport protein A [Lachnospiraceae bacterium]MCX4321259.1 FeoA family protein [Lachnospiraceae bacterium]